ncbi:regulator of G-protein signaling 9-binding protein [Nerophis lumbriciformis]|uniref:regulator of G-protein signaling 9-binding protein n=1 Tax=Nerophis lumbriciformis TaxID=546530 RepID=UPI003BA9850D
MPLLHNKVADGTFDAKDLVDANKDLVDANKDLVDTYMLVDSLMKVVACYGHLASCVGSCTDTFQLREELKQTSEKAMKLSVIVCQLLTFYLRDKKLPEKQRKSMELLWVSLSSSMELLHVDMCKVHKLEDIFSLTDSASLVLTGLQGGASEVAARALSVSNLNQVLNSKLPSNLQDHQDTKQQVIQMENMMDSMESKVNVLRWMVEPCGPQNGDLLSSTESSLALFSEDEEHSAGFQPARLVVLLLLCAAVLMASALFLCIFFS